jgi:serine O-acetyltransferase
MARYLGDHPAFATRLRFASRTPVFWILALYRWGNWIYTGAPAPVAFLCKLVWHPWNSIVSTLFDTHIGVTAQIGPGLYLGHHGGIWVNPHATLGSSCNLSQGSIIGGTGAEQSRDRLPRLGDRVWVGPHAVITGPVRIGNECVIGANSLVAMDLPDKAVVVGVPARILSYSGSARLI